MQQDEPGCEYVASSAIVAGMTRATALLKMADPPRQGREW